MSADDWLMAFKLTDTLSGKDILRYAPSCGTGDALSSKVCINIRRGGT
jgi:hypothetical protein